MPCDEEGRDLRDRLLAGDTTASNDVVAAYLDDVADWLEALYPQKHPNDCPTAAADAVLTFIRNPATYDPEKQILEKYLRMSAPLPTSKPILNELPCLLIFVHPGQRDILRTQTPGTSGNLASCVA